MNKRLITLALCLTFSVNAIAGDLYRSVVTYVPNGDKQAELERLLAIETPSEQQYLTSIALQKPGIFERQLTRAREILKTSGEAGQVESRLRTEGFFSQEVQKVLKEFFESIHPEDAMTGSRVMEFLMFLNVQVGHWNYLFAEPQALDDFSALECGLEKAPTELLGPVEHQYLMQVAHPNMQLSLWRFDPLEALTYPVATLVETTIDHYRFVDRFGNEFGSLSRDDLTMQKPDGAQLHCRKVDSAIMRAYQDHRREMILSEKQL
tara:strand:+ start:5546 stop:6337 length:792 start_codon:yes stop_codon:yes gene_type:complete